MSEVVYLYRIILLEVNCLHQEIHTTSVPTAEEHSLKFCRHFHSTTSKTRFYVSLNIFK